jgi:ketosteroid isomerase-like protein
VAIDELEFRRVADELAIRDLVARYSDAVIRADSEAWAATWAEGASWRVGPSESHGREAIVETWTRLMGIFDRVRQITEQGTVEIEGDRARGRWYVTEYGWPRQGAPNLLFGVYHDAYARIDGAWRFTRRRFDLLYTGPPDLTGRNHPFPTDVS